jgi:hypothetical protein
MWVRYLGFTTAQLSNAYWAWTIERSSHYPRHRHLSIKPEDAYEERHLWPPSCHTLGLDAILLGVQSHMGEPYRGALTRLIPKERHHVYAPV